jgi:hypothetical protein
MGESAADYRILTDEKLLAQCRFEAFRGPGPGGQKKNKTSSAVRLTHLPTGIAVTAGESRSQHRNKQAAVDRLRHRLAVQLRRPVASAQPPTMGLLNFSKKSADYASSMGRVLDVLGEARWSISQAAKAIGVTTAKLISFLRSDDKVWAEVNQQRQKIKLKTLH